MNNKRKLGSTNGLVPQEDFVHTSAVLYGLAVVSPFCLGSLLGKDESNLLS